MRKFFIVLGIAVFALACILILKDQIVKAKVIAVVSRVTGSPVTIDGLSWNILHSTVHISGFKIYNPKGFPDGVLVSCPRIDIIYDGATLFRVERHFFVVNIELAELVITRIKEGTLNVDSLNVVKSNSAPVPLQIDLVTIGIGKVVYKDYRNGSEPDVRVHDVNKFKTYKGIPTTQQLAALVMTEPMKEAGIKGAEIYGVAMLAGVAVLPIAVVSTMIGKTSVQQSIEATFERVYDVSLEVLERMGKVTQQDALKGTIQTNINGADVALKLKRVDNRTELTISARKYMFPKLDIAGGVLYQISDKL